MVIDRNSKRRIQGVKARALPRTVPYEVLTLFALVLEEERLNVASQSLLALILFEFGSVL